MKKYSSLLSWVAISIVCPLVCPLISHATEIETVLKLKTKVSMEQLAQDVSTPGSIRYHQYYSPAEIAQIAGPSQSEYEGLLAQLRSDGFKIVSESNTHLFVTVKGEQSLFEEKFSTQISFTDPVKNIHHTLRTPQIPAELNLVQSITGLDNTRASQIRSIHRSIKSKDDGGGYEPSAIKTLYGFDPIYKAGLTGAGQHIAIATYDAFFLEDVQQYYSEEGITPAPKVDAIKFNGDALIDYDSAAETELDSEFSGMIAPGAQIHVFTSAHNDDAGEVQLFTAILDDGRAKVVNYSWGDCEPNIDAQHAQDMEDVFARAVAQGVNVMVASGDSGAEGCAEQSSFALKKYNATFPGSIPYVVSVGGTSITGKNSGGVTENAWEDSGGGVSEIYPQPSWQQGFQAPFLMRSLPDVAFNADLSSGQDALVHFEASDQEWVQFGGTSIAAPQWSGFLALVGQARAQGQLATLGYLNPIIYAMTPDQRSSSFHDIIRGNNGYKAGAGWDAVTGWGSMRASDLLAYLKGL